MGIVETLLPVLACVIPVALVVIIGGGLGLLKLGVIGKYWLKGDTVEQGGNYTLNQSHDAGEDGES